MNCDHSSAIARGPGVNHPEFPKVQCAACHAWYTDPALTGRNALRPPAPITESLPVRVNP